MSTSAVVIIKYLEQSQKRDLINDLSSRLSEPSSINTLCDVLEIIDEELKLEILSTVYDYCIDCLSDEAKYSQVLQLVKSFGGLLIDKIVGTIVLSLSSYIKSSIVNFDNAFENLLLKYQFAEKVTDADIEAQTVSNIFKFLEHLFISLDNIESQELDFICAYYLGINDSEISVLSSKLLRWRIDPIVNGSENLKLFIWDMIFTLQESNDLTKINNGFILWLRFLNHSSNLQTDNHFQDIIKSAKYWSLLQNGLISNSHEHRKFSISVLQLSIKSINSNFENKLMKWDIEQTESYLDSWKRFTTLFEIIGIDTSLNQAQDAAGEMIGLLSSNSKIPVPFTLSLLSIGFKLSMETVRKFAMNLIFAIPLENLKFLKQDGFNFLKHHFLKFAMVASNFTVYKNFDEKSDKDYDCEFGENLSKFIVNCYRNLDREGVLQLSTKLIELLSENRDLFDPSKTYVSLGLLKGLQLKKQEVLNIEHLSMMNSMFETGSDGDVFNTMLQTINLRLLLFIDSSKTSLYNILQSISKFVQFNVQNGISNGYTIFDLNLEYFLDYFTKNFTMEFLVDFYKAESMSLDIDSMIVLLSIIANKDTVSSLVPTILSYPECDELLLKLINSKILFKDLLLEPLIKSKCHQIMNKLSDGSLLNSRLYELGTGLVNSKELFDMLYWDQLDLNELWHIMNEGLASDSEEKLSKSISMIGLFANVVDKSIFNESCESLITLENMSLLQQNAFSHQPIRTAIDFYKIKDLFYCHFYDILSFSTKIIDVETNKAKYFDIIDNDIEKLNRKSMNSAITLIHKILKVLTISEADTLVILQFMKTIWADITTDRLVLSQKGLHLNFIKLLFHEKILINSTNNEEILDIINEIGSEIILQCYSRKMLLPTLVKTILQFQLNHFEIFEKTYWIMEIVVQSYFLLQSINNLFRLEYVIGDLFDKELSLYYGEKLYNKIYGDEEISSRVNINMIVGAIKTPEILEHLWEYVLVNDSTFHLFKPLNRSDGYEEWRRLQLLQLLLLSIKKISFNFLYENVLNKLLQMIFKEPSPLCRMYVEWIVAYTLLLLDNKQRKQIFDKFETGILKQQQTIITSFERISYLLAQQLSNVEETEFLSKFIVEFLLPSCTSNRSLVRHFSVSLVVSIFPQVEKRNLKFEKSLYEALKLIHSSALRTENYQSYRSGDALLWDISSDFNLVGICGGVLLRISDREIDFINKRLFIKYSTPDQRELLEIPIGEDETGLFLSHELRITKPVMDSFMVNLTDEEAAETALQTKSGAWSTVMEIDESSQVKRSPLIVISSLVDKIVNLGAICRLCDCLGVGLMTLNDISVVKNPQFKTVAVTADQWMPMIELQISDIIEFMRFQKKQGYTLIGLEQTDKSVELNNELKFPKKSLILVGKEREGIPGEFLLELDFCIEIRQNGVIRSMNIQTATAIICHSYSIQHA